MKKRLSTYSLEYHMIIFYIWTLTDYYSTLFSIDTSNPATQTINKLYTVGDISYIRCSFPKAEIKDYGTLVLRMKHVFNEYLQFAILPDSILKPFCADADDKYGMLEALYVDVVFEDNSYINLDVIYVDNMKAYKHVRRDEKNIYGKDGKYYDACSLKINM